MGEVVVGWGSVRTGNRRGMTYGPTPAPDFRWLMEATEYSIELTFVSGEFGLSRIIDLNNISGDYKNKTHNQLKKLNKKK